MVRFTLPEWTRMNTALTEAEVERAKSQLKVTLLLSLDGPSAIADVIGRRVITSGRCSTPKLIENAVKTVSVDEIKQVARKYLWNKDVSYLFICLFFWLATDTLKVCPCCDRSC